LQQDDTQGGYFLMLTSFYTASVGAISTQKGIAVTANNIANVSTDGYKADKPSFSDLLYTNVRGSHTDDSALKVGHGAKLNKTDTVFTQGGLTHTGNDLDYALCDNNTFFAVKAEDGSTKYTRCGSFQKSLRSDGKFYLADSNGNLVLGASGQTIPVTDEEKEQDMGIFTFKNLDGLIKSGDNYFSSTNSSGAAETAQNAKVKQRYVESSSANLSDEMSDAIISQRAFDFNAKMIQMSDEIMQTVNSLR
jgi:flagellar basal-body rod protein FlgG